MGYRHRFVKTTLDIFAGADNVFDETYSLGNDINAAANRFFNVAPEEILQQVSACSFQQKRSINYAPADNPNCSFFQNDR